MKIGSIKLAGKVFVGIVFLLLVVIAGAYVWYRHILNDSQPKISGTIALEGIRDKIEIIRDEYGVPHVYAGNEADLYFAVGFAVAQDRLWQMEYLRRLGAGRMSEILGEDLLDVDRYFRTIFAGHREMEIPTDLAHIPRSFLAGINKYIETAADSLPLEFILLRFKPEPWRFEDILAIYHVMCWDLSMGWRVDPVAFDIFNRVGEKRFGRFFPSDGTGGAAKIAAGLYADAPQISSLNNPIGRIEELLAFSPSPASNNWVVSGEKTKSGKPILANDTHMGLTNPSLWWEVHMVCPGIDAAGFMVPGLPALAVGHTRHTAWGITNVSADDLDFFIERFNPDNPDQYRRGDEWDVVRTIREKIPVRGKEPVVFNIRLTRHGPVVKEFRSNGERLALTARWAVHDVDIPLRSAYLLPRAKTIQDVTQALKYWEAPGQNFVFADSQGNIGYWCATVIPIRSRHNGLLPVPGWSGRYDWEGFVPFEKKPHLINPAEGFIATANNRVTDASYPYIIGTYWSSPDRVNRIRQLLAASSSISIHEFRRMHADVHSRLAAELVPIILNNIPKGSESEQVKQALALLRDWDLRMEADSSAATVFEVMMTHLFRNLFAEELGPDLYEKYIGLSVFPPRALRALMRQDAAAGNLNGKGLKVGLSADVLAESLRQATAELVEVFGSEPGRWRWGELHTLTFEHVLGKKRPLDRLFNLGPFPVSGNSLTVNKKQYSYAKPYTTREGAAQRMIVDFATPHITLHVLPTGQSGLKGNSHHKDQLALYLKGEYRHVRMNRVDIEKHKEGTLTLIPRL